ncbi:MAG: hypothetical protein AB7G88_01930 [Thermomicrobiales bacterium]
MRDIFHHDDKGYSDWLDTHPDGFVLNADTKGPKQSILHSARCWTLYPLKSHESDTHPYRKICDTDRSVLEQWAVNEGHTLTDCKKCLG